MVLEPRPGSVVAMRMSDGSTYAFGVITTWQPGEVYAQTWTGDWPEILQQYAALAQDESVSPG